MTRITRAASHLWEELREKYLHNLVFPSLDELIEVLCQALHSAD